MAARTYSFKDVSYAFNSPAAGSYVSAGQVGLGGIQVMMAAERTVHDRAADGNIMVSALAGDDGSISLEVQQTSDIHAFLLLWWNLLKTAMDAGDVSNWASATVMIRSLTDGTEHYARGVSPQKIPDKPYAAQGQKVTWHLMCADLQTTTYAA